MNNKVLVELVVPSLEETYNIYIPINKRVGNIIQLVNKVLFELTNGLYVGNDMTALYDESGEKYEVNLLVRQTNIRNGSIIVLFQGEDNEKYKNIL